MSDLLILAAVIVALAVAYQIYISHRVARTPDYTDQQRRWQLIMIWCLPVVGAVLCHLMLGESAEATARDNIDIGDHDDGNDGGHGGGNGDGGAGD